MSLLSTDPFDAIATDGYYYGDGLADTIETLSGSGYLAGLGTLGRLVPVGQLGKLIHKHLSGSLEVNGQTLRKVYKLFSGQLMTTSSLITGLVMAMRVSGKLKLSRYFMLVYIAAPKIPEKVWHYIKGIKPVFKSVFKDFNKED